MAWIKQVILAVRQIRGEMDIAPVAQDPAAAAERRRARRDAGRKHYARTCTRLAGLESVHAARRWREPRPNRPRAIVGELTLLVPMAGSDRPESRDRAFDQSASRKNESDIGKLSGKLGNENFVRNAPPDVVAADRARVAELEAQNASLAHSSNACAALGCS